MLRLPPPPPPPCWRATWRRLHVGLGLQQLVERLELVRHRRGWSAGARVRWRPAASPRWPGPSGRRRRRSRWPARAGGAGRRCALGPAAGCPASLAARCSRARWAVAIALHVVGRLGAAGAAAAGVELPGGDDDFLLRGGEILHALRLAAGGHRLALRRDELVVERLDLEEEHVAARLRRRLAAADVARPHEVADEVAGRDLEILEEEQVAAAGGQPVARAGQRHHHLGIAGLLQHQVERGDAEVVVGAGLDQHFFERGHLAIAGRPHHAHVGRTVEQRADEILGVVGRVDAVVVDQRHAVGVVGGDGQRRRSRCGRRRCSGTRAPSASTSALRRHRTIGGDGEAHLGARGRVDVAAVVLGARRQLQRRRDSGTRARSARPRAGARR